MLTSRPFMRRATMAIAAGAVLLLVFSACSERQSAGRQPPPPLNPPAAVAGPAQTAPAQPPQPKPAYTLILTWMNADQPPQTTQTAFHDLASCEQARDAAIAEGRRLALEAMAAQPAATGTAAPVTRRYVGTALLPTDTTPPAPASSQASAPRVAAICAAA